ncbi:ABC transporter permease [Cognatazoarcus halotolerans]|uniref:ABC transporter permease n=1 Tax=Cognatazoarcus halotolerans TaxID=2686016 RepID=UPI00135CD87F|nr:ABC transporter permease [Cognatazoarcus halotolerans]MCB1898733.1 ABC transporter permease [Rhodocyclaceae bacterium]MCP5310446.1 ABC transporter permease [Zoogloeaceae bacterium]
MLQGYLVSLLEGAWLTLQVAVLSLVLALLLGLVGASAKLSRIALLRIPALAYTTVVRGIPDLVMMLLVFYGGQIGINEITDRLGWDYVDVNPFAAGVATLGFIFGAYFTETFRGAFLAVPAGQLEAGYAYGMTRWQVFRRILFPQMLRHALPGLGNNWQVMQKSTALVSIIGLSDLTWLADQAGRSTHQPFLFYAVVCVFYLAMTAASSVFFRHLERRFNVGVRRAAA